MVAVVEKMMYTVRSDSVYQHMTWKIKELQPWC